MILLPPSPSTEQRNALNKNIKDGLNTIYNYFFGSGDDTKMISPVKDPVISSEQQPTRVHPVDGMTKPHNGIDIVDKDPKKTAGKDVVAPADGKIESIKSKDDGNGAGNRIHMKDEEGNKHSLFHLSDKKFGEGLNNGSDVEKGQKLGEIGNTGKSTAPHLHYEIRNKDGKILNPRTANPGLENAPTVKDARKKTN